MQILPAADALTRPYWDAVATGEFRIQNCDTCGHWWHPPAPICPRCQATAVTWREASGLGTVHTFTVAHHPFHPAVLGRTPYVIALIDLDEGPRVVANIRNCAPESVHIGQRVSVLFERIGEGVVLPQFQPVE
jgi:uncharacterized protein